MNITSSISKRDDLEYTLLGGDRLNRDRKNRPGLSIVILNRGGRPYRRDYFREIRRLGVSEIFSIENADASADHEEFLSDNPDLRFILIRKNVSIGEQVNIGIEESDSECVLVLWNDMKLLPTSVSSRIFGTIADREDICVIPSILLENDEIEPNCITPLQDKKGDLKTLPVLGENGALSLYPSDYTGVYNRRKFLLSGGYDFRISASYWQKMEFGLRCYMMGEKIPLLSSLKIKRQDESSAEDTTRDFSYALFWLKTLAVKVGRRKYLPGKSFYPFKRNSSLDHDQARSYFDDIRLWVEKNSSKYVNSALSVLNDWNNQNT